MGTNSIETTQDGRPFRASLINQYKDALNEEVVGRENGVPKSGQSLGSSEYPWGDIYVDNAFSQGENIDLLSLSTERYRIIDGNTVDGLPAFITPSGKEDTATLHGASTPLKLSIEGQIVTINRNIDFSFSPRREDISWSTYEVIYRGIDGDRIFANEFDRVNTIRISSSKNLDIGEQVCLSIGYTTTITIPGFSDTVLNTVSPVLVIITNKQSLAGNFIYEFKAIQNYEYFINHEFKTRTFYLGLTLDKGKILPTSWVFVFANNPENLFISSRSPVYQASEPDASRFNEGDFTRMWYNTKKQKWNIFNPRNQTFTEVSAIPIGIIVSSLFASTRSPICAKSFNFSRIYSEDNTITISNIKENTKQLLSDRPNNTVSVAGKNVSIGQAVWSLDETRVNGTVKKDDLCYLYITDTGETVIDAFRPVFGRDNEVFSDIVSIGYNIVNNELAANIAPVYRPQLKGYYHPSKNWRCVGQAYITESSGELFFSAFRSIFISTKYNPKEKYPLSYPVLFRRSVSGAITLDDPYSIVLSSRIATFSSTDSGPSVIIKKEAIAYVSPIVVAGLNCPVLRLATSDGGIQNPRTWVDDVLANQRIVSSEAVFRNPMETNFIIYPSGRDKEKIELLNKLL